MEVSVLLLLALSSATNNAEQRNVSFTTSDLKGSPELTANRSTLTDLPPLTVAKSRQRRQVRSSSFVSDDGSNLEWVTWNNSLPKDAVSLYNSYTDRTDYVCKYMCEAGFYSPSKGPYCHYANSKKAYPGTPFEILVNKDIFEILEWKEDSYGSVPQDSVRTCAGVQVYVGKNKYGLGKVATQDEAFYLPWEDYQYYYRYYQVLTTNKNIMSQQIYDVLYNTNESKILKYPPEIMHETAISNYECHPVVKKDTLSRSYQVERRWDTTYSTKAGVKTSIKVAVPFITDSGIEIGLEQMFQYSEGNVVIEAITDTLSMEVTVPPKHACKLSMVRYKCKVDIPFTASLSRTYGNGERRTTSISGTYDSVQIGEVQVVVERCEYLDGSKPCT
ncbi:natterin-3-like [Pempheris klunzingeri]|uniref:natterin-3-like n=1 Tax=Pempheris klunzingeri TaxID=3127111 RepID=UPI003980A83E